MKLWSCVLIDHGLVICRISSISYPTILTQSSPRSVRYAAELLAFILKVPFPAGLDLHVKRIFCLILQMKNANVLGFCWTNWNEIVFITDQGIEFYQVSPPRSAASLLLCVLK